MLCIFSYLFSSSCLLFLDLYLLKIRVLRVKSCDYFYAERNKFQLRQPEVAFALTILRKTFQSLINRLYERRIFKPFKV